MPHPNAHGPHRGAVTLALTATLLLVTSLVALYTQRRLWFEQQASSNQVRSIRASELAQAGLDWALAQLNTPAQLADAPSCQSANNTVGAQLFRERYASPRAAQATTPRGLYPPADASAGCSLTEDGALQCSCPSPGQAVDMPNSQAGRFVVQFVAAADDPLAIDVLSTGHAEGGGGLAQVRQTLKLAHALVHPPAAAVLVGGNFQAAGPLRIINQDPVAQGVPLRAGGSVTTGADTVLQALSSVIEHDATLAQLRAADLSGERFFEVIAGRTLPSYLTDPMTTVIDASTCGTPTECGAALVASHRRGGQQFWLKAEVSLSPSTQLGSVERPVLIATPGRLNLSGDSTIRGMVIAGDLHIDDPAAGGTAVVGALVVRGDLVQGAGALSVSYDRTALGMAGGAPMGLLTPVPGTWRDQLAGY
ncbi:MAG: hypothetical protein Q8S02_07880 [Hydrogenophaga sp.]|nr:hypothetical protein [Hydrogenophaga sp.]